MLINEPLGRPIVGLPVGISLLTHTLTHTCCDGYQPMVGMGMGCAHVPGGIPMRSPKKDQSD